MDNRGKILFLDAEGGYGGSSRSLYQLVKNLNKKEWNIFVWYRKKGPIKFLYNDIGIPCFFESKMISSGALERLNIIAIYELLKQLFLGIRMLFRLKKIAKCVDIVHINLESMFLLSLWIRLTTDTKIVVHIRTLISKTLYGKIESKIISKTAHYCIYITENEEKRFRSLGGKCSGRVLYNIVDIPEIKLKGFSNKLFVLSMGKYEWIRGTDRILDVAQILYDRSIDNIQFIILGDMRLPRFRSPDMKKKLFQTNSLEELVKIRSLEKYFNFKGYINNPFETISDCDIYIQLSRVTAPWSRSILESMSMGLPVMATGTYSEFVKNGENGFLYPYFDPKKIADDLVWCYENQSKMHKMGFRGRLIVKNKCDGKTYAQNISSIYSRLIG